MSVKGRAFHNLPLDEANESIINRKLKQITTRPSHFRMVELADFMAYLDFVVSGLEDFALKWHKHEENEKITVSARNQVVYGLINSVDLFANDTVRPLCNVFVENPKKLDICNVEDLLSITMTGQERMISYIKQYILKPPTELENVRNVNAKVVQN